MSNAPIDEETSVNGETSQVDPMDPAADLKSLLESEKAKADAHWERLLRMQADLDNIQRRAERDVQNAHRYSIEKLAKELLPVVDSLEEGLKIQAAEETAKSLQHGLEITLQMLSATLERFQIVPIKAEGEKFDPTHHEAIAMQESADMEPGMVLIVIQKGYMLHDRVIRPARVLVSKAPGG